MNFRKVFCLIISVVLVLGMITGCGKKAKQKNEGENTSGNVTETVQNENTPTHSPDVPEKGTTPSGNDASPACVPQIEGYTLLWNDEFDGECLDMDIWSHDPR